MVLHLSRGGFDPKEHQFVGQLVDVYPEFRNAYTRLVFISTDNQLNINEFRDALGATWPFLSDPDRVVQKDLDIKEFTDEPHDPMIPHTFVLEPGLKIFKIYNGYWYWGRPTMAELHVDLRGVFKKIRPDFDLAAPGLREAWERGDRDQFLVDTLEEPIRYTEGKTIGISTFGSESDSTVTLALQKLTLGVSGRPSSARVLDHRNSTCSRAGRKG